MTKEDLKDKSVKEIQEMMDRESTLFKDEVAGIDSLEELMKMEVDIIEEMKEYDKYLDDIVYPVIDQVEYNGKKYSKNDIASAIIYFLNKSEVEWSYTLGLYQLVCLWKNKDLNTIKYKEYDSTLRTLNTVKFKGFNEWQDILAINEYLSSCHKMYTVDTSWVYYLSDKHNVVMNRIKELDKPQEKEVEPQCC